MVHGSSSDERHTGSESASKSFYQLNDLKKSLNMLPIMCIVNLQRLMAAILQL